MSQQLLFLNTKSLSHTLAVYVPDDWDYWTMNGDRKFDWCEIVNLENWQ